jgi:hypothetical protein
MEMNVFTEPYLIGINYSAAPPPTTVYLPGKMWELSCFENDCDKRPISFVMVAPYKA